MFRRVLLVGINLDKEFIVHFNVQLNRTIMNRFQISTVDAEANGKGIGSERGANNNGEVQLNAYNLIASTASASTLSPPPSSTSESTAIGVNGVAAGSGTNAGDVMQRKFSIAQLTRLVEILFYVSSSKLYYSYSSA